jgi:Tfp pilus assembly protein PilF
MDRYYVVRKKSLHRWKKHFLFYAHLVGLSVMMALIFITILWTGSRGAALALAIGTLIVVYIRFSYRGLGIVILLVSVFLLVPSPLHERLKTEHIQNPLGYARWQIWHSSVKAMIDSPLGAGIGLFQYIYPRYAVPVEGQIARYGKMAQTAHNEYLQMGVELGVISLPIFLGGVVLVVRDAKWILNRRLHRWQRGLVVGLSGALAAFLIHAAIDSSLHEPALAILLTVFVGIILAIRRMFVRDSAPRRMLSIRPRLITSLAGVCVIMMLSVPTVRFGFAWMAYEAGSRDLQNRDLAAAIAKYQTAIALDPGKALYHSSLGAAHFSMFQQTHDRQSAQSAVEELETAMELNPLDGRLSGLLGHVYVNFASSLPRMPPTQPAARQPISWLRAAKVAYERALELEPFAPFYLLELGHIYHALGNYKAAEICMKRTIQIEPNFLPGRQWLTNNYLQTGRTVEADRQYQEILIRRQRYASSPKDATESRFLSVDLITLAAMLGHGRSKI